MVNSATCGEAPDVASGRAFARPVAHPGYGGCCLFLIRNRLARKGRDRNFVTFQIAKAIKACFNFIIDHLAQHDFHRRGRGVPFSRGGIKYQARQEPGRRLQATSRAISLAAMTAQHAAGPERRASAPTGRHDDDDEA